MIIIKQTYCRARPDHRLRGTLSKSAEQKGKSVDQVASERMASIPAKRFGNADEFGAACASCVPPTPATSPDKIC